MLDAPPDFIMMSLMDSKTYKPRSKHTLAGDFNLLQDENSDMVMIPVGYGLEDNVLEVANNKTKIFYQDHPLELSFAFTVWKVQGLTFDKIILQLEQSKGKGTGLSKISTLCFQE